MQYRSKNVIPDTRVNSIVYRVSLFCLFSLLAACGGGSGGTSVAGACETTLCISGKVTVPSDSDVDVDLNGSAELNNDSLDPQIINNPSTIGGYLSGYAGSYASGNNFTADQLDYYSVSLVQNQEMNISLFQADEQLSSIDFSLALLDESEQVVADINLTTFTSSTLVAPADGQFILELSVSPGSDPALYTLSLSQTLNSQVSSKAQALSITQHAALKHEFVPGEVLLRYKQQGAVDDANTIVSKLASPSVSAHAAFAKDHALELQEVIPGVARRYRFTEQHLTMAFALVKSSDEQALNALEAKLQTLALIETLKEAPELAYVEPNYLYRSMASTNDPRLSEQWNLPMLATGAAWEVSTGQNVVVAVLDTGIDASHEDLQANILASGFDFISSSDSAGDGNGFDADPNDEGSSFHGSHVTGIIAAQADNTKGIAGIAYEAKVMPLRVLGTQDTGSSSDIAQAILYAAGLSNSSGQTPAAAADIINMSFGGEARSETVKSALDQAFQTGLILIAAAGNGGSQVPFYPAAFDNVVGVGAISSDKNHASFSNFGVNVQLVAPGGTGSGSASLDGFEDAILSTVNANNYRELAGTSMAAPHVAAVAALMKSLKQDLTGAQFNTALAAGNFTDVINSQFVDSNNFFGAGLINAAKSVNWAAGANIIPATLSIYPTQFGFIGSNTKADLSLLNPGSGSLIIKGISVSDNWIAIAPKQTDALSGLGSYEVQVSVTQAPIDQGEIVITYQIDSGPEQTERLKVFTSRSNQTDSSVGVVFVSLYKEEDILNDRFQPLVTVGGQLSDGAYHYCFSNIPAGRYLLSASTDNDGDQVSFDKGEASGTYPLQSRPDFINLVDLSLSNINFTIQYPAFISSDAATLPFPAILDKQKTFSLKADTHRKSVTNIMNQNSIDKFRAALQQGLTIDDAQFMAQSVCVN